MDDLPRGPSSLLKTFTITVRWSFGVLLAAWLVFGLAWAALHLFIVPRIGELRPELEARATQALGVPVRIGAISARSGGLIPSFELTDVRLLDAAGVTALHLPRVLAALSPSSLLRLGFEQLYIDQPRLQVRRTADGRLLVAGLDLSQDAGDGDAASDWFFSQTEFVIHQGQVEWRDELRGESPLTLEQVDFVARNGARTHALRLDASPPPAWGRRFTLLAQFRQPLLSTHAGRWRSWEGQVHAAFEQVDLSQLRRHAKLGVDVLQGHGAVRAWVDVAHGQVSGATADVALAGVRLVPAPGRAVLTLPVLTGRLAGKRLAGGFEVSSHDLKFETDDGLRWPGGNVRLSHVDGGSAVPVRGELQADQLDLEALARIAERLPLQPRLQKALASYAPQGLVERVQASWQGPLEAPLRLEARGRVTRLAVAAQAATDGADAAVLGRPGVRGATVDFELTQAGGRASVSLQDGQLEFPGLFEEPVLPFAQLSGDVQWQQEGGQLSVQVPNLKFSNADAQGEAQLKWQSAAAGPGVLDLQGSMGRADGARVHRYLPQVLDRATRHYVRDAVPRGRVSAGRFRVKGDLRNFPFVDPRQGEFSIAAQVREADFAYVPASIQASGEKPWPALTHVNGDLLIERASLQLRHVSARVANTKGLHVTRAEGGIADFLHQPSVTVSAEARGPLDEMLGALIRKSPLAALTGPVLAQASGTGSADYQFKLALPLAAPDKATVQGKVELAGNELQLGPDIPRLSRARGTVYFSESGFAVSAGRARALGGDLRAEGGTIHVPNSPGAHANAPAQLRVQGTATADGLRQARELGALARLARRASGSTPYTVVLGLRRGMAELQVQSNLQGLALGLPAPLNKGASAALPLRLDVRALPESAAAPGMLLDQLSLELGRLASAQYVRDVSQAATRVLRGTVSVGLAAGEVVPMPAQGVVARAQFEQLDIDDWRAILEPPTGTGGLALPKDAAQTADALYLPTSLALQAREVVLDGRRINQVVAGGTRTGSTWRANLEANELSGYLEYRPSAGSDTGRLYARLARLVLAPSAVRDVESLLDEPPVSIPALDIVVGDLELRGKRLGRVEVEAVNRNARDWRLNKFNVIVPEALFTATGNWAYPDESGARGRTRRRTSMNFKLELRDAGELLNRLGMPGVIRKGVGKMEGQVAWSGSPLALDYPTLGGAFNVNVEAGQFLKADPGMAKLLGVLSLQALPRRLTLDFRDVFSEGFAFDFVRGDIHIGQGIASTNNLQMKGVNAAVLMDGRADIAKETQDLKVVVVPEINAGTASLIATWINPTVGLGSFLAQLLLRTPLIASNTQEFHIDGSWSEPRVTQASTKPAADGSAR
jgi:uncharacterized protein (TIGR02099 family)